MSDPINARIRFIQGFAAIILVACQPAVSQQNSSAQKVGQQSPSAESEGRVPTFKSRSDLVLVPVVVRDQKGRHVSGLGKESFQLEEKGKEQTVALFEEVSPPTIDAVGAATRYQGYSNLPFDNANQLRLTIIVIDLLNTNQLQRTDGKDQVKRFLAKGLPPNQPVSLLCITNKGLKLVQPFTSDTKILIEALDKTPTTPIVVTPHWDAVKNTIWQIGEIAQAYAGIPGRKTMIFFEGEIPELATEHSMFGSTQYSDDLRKLWSSLVDANVSVYPVQLLATAKDPSIGGLSSRPSDLLLRQFASNTGGNECVESNSLFGCLTDAVEDSRSYYMLGFKVQENDRKPGWRDLKVKVSAEHVNIRTRNGFYYGVQAAPDSKSVHNDEINALASSLAYSAVPIYVQVLGSLPGNSGSAGVKAEKSEVGLLLTIPLSSIQIDAASSSPINLDVGAIALTSDVREAAEFLHPVRGNPKPENLQEWTRSGLRLQEKLELPPGSYDVRLLVRDNNASQIGTVVFPLNVN